MKYIHIPPNKIHTVYLAPGTHFTENHVSDAAVHLVRRKYGLPEQYLLAVGTIEPRKNLTILLQVLKQIRDRSYPRVALVMVGRQGWQRAWSKNGVCTGSVLMTGVVEDQDLPAIYRGACAVVFPSWYEGFGLPLVEAMACGVPVVASNRPALPEIGGKACLYADPADPETWVTQITRLLDNPVVAQGCITKGFQQVKRFSWERAARTILQLYEQIAARS
jgi:glycosyltransferase involved in cell wall biosynthesis